jgi:gliding motility-associated-like protein
LKYQPEQDFHEYRQTPMRKILHFLIFLILPIFSYSEGVKELRPDSTVSFADLYFTNGASGGTYPNFGLINCLPNYRLYIHVKNAGESILFGLGGNYGIRHYNLRKPDGTIAMTGQLPYYYMPGFINYFHQAKVGPFPSTGGYTPFVYTVSNAADTGNYYFELTDVAAYTEVDLPLWDFQIVSGAHTPAWPVDTINGRVWSQSWQFDADLGANFELNCKLYVLSDDGIVTKLTLNHARVGVVDIFCNPTGSYNTGNPVYDRKSEPINTFSTFPGIAQYKVFLNNPDTSVYHSGVFGSITGTPVMIPDPLYPPCNKHKLIQVDVTKPGNVEVDLSFPYGAPATNVSLFSPVNTGINTIAWNGNDGLGNPVPNGTLVSLKIIYTNGLTNLPIWDQEQNPNGFKISLVRPPNPAYQYPLLFWDDSNIPAGSDCPTGINLTGCYSIPLGCHTWSGMDCHDRMINTWWYGNSGTTLTTSLFTVAPLAAIGHDSTRCGPGSVTLLATVPPYETVDWYDTISGGVPLLIGNTTFITPVLSATKIFYAEARTDSSVCTNPIRTPVTAVILPSPVPRIHGPRFVCDSSQGNLYTTEPSMSNYSWTISPGNLITSGIGTNSINVTWLEPGNQGLSVAYSNSYGCLSQPTRLNVYVSPEPGNAGQVDGPEVICAGTYNQLYSVAPILYATDYHWTVPPGAIIVTGMNSDSIVVDFPSNAQSGNITVYGSDSCGNGKHSTLPVVVHQPPISYAGPGDTICQGSSFQVTHATAVNYSRLFWISSGQGTLTEETTLSPTYHPSGTETGQVTLSLIAYGAPACANDTSKLILLINPKPLVEAGQDDSICEGRSFRLTQAYSSNYQSLIWTNTGSGIIVDPTSATPIYIPSLADIAAGSVLLTLTVSGLIPCPPVSDFLRLYIIKAPVVAAGSSAITCETLPIVVYGASASNYDHLVWTHNGTGTLTNSQTLTPIYTPGISETGIVTLTLTAYGRGACSDTSVKVQTEIQIYSAVEAEAGPDKIIPFETPDTLSGTISGGSGEFHYQWWPGTFLLDTTTLNPVTVPLIQDTMFILSVIDLRSGCSASDTIHIRIERPKDQDYDCIKIHNVITPNGDGLNDKWIIDCIENYPENVVEIFNEWGDLVNKFSHYDNDFQVWKGTNFEGVYVPDGTYYYVLTIKDLKPRIGWILVRGGWK